LLQLSSSTLAMVCFACTLASVVLPLAFGLRRSRHGLEAVNTCGQKRTAPAEMSHDVNMSIVNGRPAAECSWPWQIHLGGCGGTLIAPDWVLSAAHCGSPRTAYAGLRNMSNTWEGQQRTVTQTIFHPRYRSPKQFSNDLALLKLDRPFDLNECVNTACLPATAVPVGKKCWITGWGNLRNQGSRPQILQEASTDIHAQSTCSSSMGSNMVSDDMVCVLGTFNGQQTSACNGDSGGPLVCEEGGQWFVHGATSWGRSCTGYSIYNRAAYNQAWITQTTGVTPPGTPSPTPGPPTPTPAPTPPTPPTPTPPPPTGGCEHEKDCNVSAWCTDTSFEEWCRQQGLFGQCPAPFCRQA